MNIKVYVGYIFIKIFNSNWIMVFGIEFSFLCNRIVVIGRVYMGIVYIYFFDMFKINLKYSYDEVMLVEILGLLFGFLLC